MLQQNVFQNKIFHIKSQIAKSNFFQHANNFCTVLYMQLSYSMWLCSTIYQAGALPAFGNVISLLLRFYLVIIIRRILFNSRETALASGTQNQHITTINRSRLFKDSTLLLLVRELQENWTGICENLAKVYPAFFQDQYMIQILTKTCILCTV